MNRRNLFFAACAGMFLVGIVLAILGALLGLPGERERLGINLAQQGDVLFALFFGFFVSTLIVGPLIDSFGNKLVMAISAALVAIALGLFSLAHAFVPAMIAASLLGFGGGGLNTAANALTADIYPENRGTMLNVLGTFYGVGALFVSLVAVPLIAASLAAVSAIGYLVLAFPQPREPSGFSILASVRAARTRGVLLFACILLVQSGNEAAIGGWTSTYTASLGALAVYWAALMFGRLLASQLLKVITPAQLVLASAIGSVIGCVLLLVSRSFILGAAIIGLSFASIYPTMLAMAADRYERLAGTIFGFLFAAGLIGGMFFPFAIGHISQHYGVRAGMVLPLAGAVGIAALTLGGFRRRYPA